MKNIALSDLLLNADGSIYHLNLHPEELAPFIILVGDPARVARVTQHFDRVDVRKSKREFIIHTGRIGKQPVSVISTGIGVGNIDIVLNEVDALADIDFASRSIKPQTTPLTLVRLGTCGSLDASIEPGQLIVSASSYAFDGLMQFYEQALSERERELLDAVHRHFENLPQKDNAYVAYGDDALCDQLKKLGTSGMTLTCPGFYGPQARQVRVPLAKINLMELAKTFKHDGLATLNFEMETAAIYALGRTLGHHCCSVSVVVANRITDLVSDDPTKAVDKMITNVLDELF